MKREHMSPSFVRIMIQGVTLLVVLLLAMPLPARGEGGAKSVAVTVIHTSNVTGHLFPCPT